MLKNLILKTKALDQKTTLFLFKLKTSLKTKTKSVMTQRTIIIDHCDEMKKDNK